MEIVLEKTKRGRILLRYENLYRETRWIDMEALLMNAADFGRISQWKEELLEAATNYGLCCISRNRESYPDEDATFDHIYNLISLSNRLQSVDALESADWEDIRGEKTEIFRCEC